MSDNLTVNEVLEKSEEFKELSDLAREASILKGEISDTEEFVKKKKDRLSAISATILKTLDILELDSFRGHGYLFFKETRETVQTPKTIEDKRKLFEFLKEKGIYEELVSVNSQTLNSLYKSLSEEAMNQGILQFDMPGVGVATPFTTLKLKKG